MHDFLPSEVLPFSVVRTRWKNTVQWLKRIGVGLGVGLGLVATLMPTEALSASPLPAHWMSYAQLASNQFAAWLSDPADDAVVRLHGWMQERLLKDGPPISSAVVARVWVAPSGKVERLELPSLGNAEADKDLRTLLTRRALSEPPPPDMRQPMVLELKLDFPQKP